MRGGFVTVRTPQFRRPSNVKRIPVDQALAVISVLALAVTVLVGTFAALAFIVSALALFALNPLDTGRTLLRYWPLLLLPLLCIASTLWSDAPQRTLRAGLQLFLTMVAGMVVARKLEPGTLLAVLFLGCLGICTLAVPWIPYALAYHLPLAEPFESKNALGFAAHLLFALALFVLCNGAQRVVLRLVAAAAIPLALVLAWMSQSSGAEASFGITLLVFVALLLFGRVHVAARVALVVLVLALLAVALTFLPAIEQAITAFRADVLQKDATLTGRTYLWDFAARISAERPLFGHGYYAFWRQGNIDAEGLWRWGGIASREGFNFHNAFVETRVDLGLFGVMLFGLTCAGILGFSFWRHFVRPSAAMAFFIALQAVVYSRSLGESGMFAPFSVGTALLVAAGVYAGRRDAAGSLQSASLPRRPRLESFKQSKSAAPRRV